MPRKQRKYLFLLIFYTFSVIHPVAAQDSTPRFNPVPPPAAGRSAAPAAEIPAPQLLAALRSGGHTVFFRHTSTDFSRDDVKSRSDDDCANQRPLTEKGREEARHIGVAMRQLGIPIGDVLASPRCRTIEVAQLAFGHYRLEQSVRGGTFSDKPVQRYDGLRALFETGPRSKSNTVIVSHGNPFYATAGAPYLAEGEAAIIKPLGKDFEVIARVRWDGWTGLAK